MLRIHFTPADLGRVTLAAGPDVMLELQHSVLMLNGAWGGSWTDRWRRSVLPKLSPRIRPVLDLMPVLGTRPDFLTPVGARDFGTALDRVVTAPTTRIRAELAEVGPLSPWARDLAAGDVSARRELGAVLTAYHNVGLAPEWHTVSARVTADRASRGQVLLDAGLDRLLDTLHPDIRWTAPTLTIRCPAAPDQALEFHLDGSGLTLVPLFFGGVSSFVRPPDGPAILGYPIPHDPTPAAPGDRLVSLLGRTRAAVLSTLSNAGSTTQVAHRVGTSVASASQHATVLRDAGLITTTRVGGSVVHALTPLGQRILEESTIDPSSVR
ncbi:winged helix-turn-helix domain-containing protein [Longispora sp. K20-0274]|uniref:ArsR/SmtB family transcription factor n=1 Tax=Longispora sp. K20-0274 TaxID=3088255 RepID=UPI00399A68DD